MGHFILFKNLLKSVLIVMQQFLFIFKWKKSHSHFECSFPLPPSPKMHWSFAKKQQLHVSSTTPVKCYVTPGSLPLGMSVCKNSNIYF